jgi:hypothetical protein
MSGSELLNRLCNVWWGTDLLERGFQFEGHKVAAGTRLESAATEGVIRECVREIQAAGMSCALVGIIRTDDPLYPFERIEPDEWSTNSFHGWGSDLLSGIFRFDDEPMSEHSGKPILFEHNKAEEWLAELRSPHLLRQPPFADPEILPARSYVTFSEAVSWLVYGKVMSSDELDATQLEDRRHVVRYAEDEDEEGETEIEFGEWFAPYLAELVRLEDANRILLDAMARGKLGANEQNGDANLSGAKLQDVQFKRHDLERLWGSVAGGDSSGASETSRLNREGADRTGGASAPPEFVPTQKLGRPEQNELVLKIFDQLAPEGKTKGVTWRILAQQVSKKLRLKEARWTISGDSLRKAVSNRK